MRPLYLLSALGLSCTLLVAPPVTAQTYAATDLGVLAPNQLSSANEISKGEIVGTGVINGKTRAFLLTLDYKDHRNRECAPCRNR
jgi:hypothetical protein